MRKIKYRAYLIQYNKMVDVTAIDFQANIFFFNGIGICEEFCIDEFGISSAPFGNQANPILEYTGLKDSQGNEIYEGDIIRSKLNIEKLTDNEKQNFFLNKEFFDQVILRTGSFGIALTDKVFWDLNGFLKHDLYIREVAGNIYQNPDLVMSNVRFR